MAAGEVVLGEDLIELAPEVEADVGRWSYLESPFLSQLRQEEAFLKGSDHDDLPELAEWVESTRAELRELRAQAAEAEATRLERAENFKGALEYAQIRLRMEPLSEDSYRQVARLQYLLGDRAAALATLERGRAMLEQELGAEPLPETLRLLRMIESGAHLPDAPPKPKSPLIPATTLRPPVLAGREREWAMMEEAWEAGKLIFLKGQPGVGKSRLAADFLEHKGSYIRLEARPGDPHVPYSSNFRHLRAILAKYPTEPLPDWVRQALAPWMPELGPSPAPVEPSPLQQARFFEAHREIFSILVRHHEAMLLDDLQFQDASSNQVGAYLMSSVLPLGPSGLRGYIGCYRSGDNSEGMDRFAAQFVETGEGVLIELEPLDPDSVLTLLQGLELPGADRLAAGLSRYTGGNPLFILETLKHLIETDTLERGLPARLAPPGRVAPLIQRRLQRLTPAALNLARAAAVAETEFGLGLAQEVLERSGLELAESHAELEAAQILRGNAFTHDLVFEAVLAGIPTAVKQVLHSRTAKYLEMIGADPALIAQHWLEADERKAVPFLLEAAKAARSTYHLFDAADFYERAAALLERQERPTEAAEALLNVCEFILDFDTGARAERLAQKILELARDPRSSSRAWLYQATLHLHRGQTPEGERAAQQALENALRSGDRGLEVDPLNLLGIVWRRQGRFEESRAALEQARELCLETHNETLLAAVLSNLGLALQQLNRYAEAAQRFQEAFALQKDRTTRGRVLNNLAICLGQLGRSREALETLERAREMLAETEGATGAHLVVLTSLANHHRLLLEYRRSLEYLEQARAMVEGYQHWKLEDLYRNFARTLNRARPVRAGPELSQPGAGGVHRGLPGGRVGLARADPPLELERAEPAVPAKPGPTHAGGSGQLVGVSLPLGRGPAASPRPGPQGPPAKPGLRPAIRPQGARDRGAHPRRPSPAAPGSPRRGARAHPQRPCSPGDLHPRSLRRGGAAHPLPSAPGQRRSAGSGLPHRDCRLAPRDRPREGAPPVPLELPRAQPLQPRHPASRRATPLSGPDLPGVALEPSEEASHRMAAVNRGRDRPG